MACPHFLSYSACQVCGPREVGYIAELNGTGDTKYTWDRKSPRECEAAHEHFDAMKKKGFLVFKVGKLGCRGKKPVEDFDPKTGSYVYVEGQRQPAEVAKTFDPKANYVATPPVVGG